MHRRGKQMISVADFLPEKLTLSALRTAAKGCRDCHLYKNATQTVFGSGPAAIDSMSSCHSS